MPSPARPALVAVIAALTLLAVACGSEDEPGAGSAQTGDLTVSGSATPAAQTVTPQLPEPAPQSGSDTKSEPVSAIPSRAAASGSVTFTHDGFRIDVERVVTVDDFEPYGSGEQARITVALRNLSAPSGGIDTRATINFGGPFANMLVLPTPDGVRLVHLNRDGSLQETADDGRFT